MNATQPTRSTVSNPANASSISRFATMSLRELVDHIVSTHHTTLRKLMPRALKLLDECSAMAPPSDRIIIALRDVLEPMWEEMQDHIVREEQVIFPAIELLDHARTRPGIHCGDIDGVIHGLEHDHHLAAEAQRLVRDLTHAFEKPVDALPAYAELMDTLAALDADLTEHTHVEDAVLFPRARQVEAEIMRKG